MTFIEFYTGVMAVFEYAVQCLLIWEGGYINSPNDPGGETNYGISSRSFPHIDIKNLTKQQAKAIYKKEFWNANPFFNELKDEEIAAKLFLAVVHMGVKQACKLMQRAVRSWQYLEADGIIGNKSITAINKLKASELIPAFNSEVAGYYRTLVAKRPELKVFINGWLNRAYGKLAPKVEDD